MLMEKTIMTTRHLKINVTFTEATADLLSHLAQKEHKPVASLVKELTLEALEQREDFYLSKLAEKLDQDGAKIFSHDEAWK